MLRTRLAVVALVTRWWVKLSGLIVLISMTLMQAGCGSGTAPHEPAAALSPAAALGELIFKDVALSASGRLACASCHDPEHGHASPFATPVAFGGLDGLQAGLRNPPSLRYLRFNSAFVLAADGSASGGFDWDGRAASLSEQAQRPFLATHEMANADAAQVIARLAARPYAARFEAVFGAGILQRPVEAFARVAFALERYQREDPDFAPFTSKYDAFVAGAVALSPQELAGLALFNRADKGNCAACHPSTRPANAPGALFTDFSYDALGVPRETGIAANQDAQFFDLGLCGPVRTDLATQRQFCGAFKVPTLRNVALRTRFFHNGRFASLEDVLRFYVTRDTDAARWYPLAADGSVQAYNDLPPELRGNVNTQEAPYNRRAGQAAALDEAEIQALLAFLRTLSDGYRP